ncbi:hypothetical protein ACQRXC_18100 [Niallia taxi]|uniref:hypothetical protein n=1 Tax=Niallia taxi TaxID=2499688 RepID=UPI003F5E0FEF
MFKTQKLFVLGDQVFTALYNFIFVLTTSLILPTKEFVIINYMVLLVMFVVNVCNAIVFQPFMRQTNKKETISKGLLKLVQKYLSITFLLSILIFLIFSKIYNVNYEVLILGYFWLLFLTIYELCKRINMVTNRWKFNFFSGLLLNCFTWGIVYLLLPRTNKEYLFISVIILGCILLANLIMLKINIVNTKQITNTPYEKIEFKQDGKILLGGAISFWFISGGYLLFLSGILSVEEISNLRIIQNLFNGILILSTTLDNYILAGNGKEIHRNQRMMRWGLIGIIIIYSVVVYFAAKIIYPENISLVYLLPIWLVFYLILGLSRFLISLIKYFSVSRTVFTSQFLSAVTYIVLMMLWSFFFNFNAYIVSILWLPSVFIILLINLQKMRYIDKQMIMEEYS